jgi:hypothetical protein
MQIVQCNQQSKFGSILLEKKSIVSKVELMKKIFQFNILLSINLALYYFSKKYILLLTTTNPALTGLYFLKNAVL